MENRLPLKIFYKYTDPDTAFKILSSKTIMFSNPSDFNDPFDCHQELIDWELTNEGINKIVDRQFPNISGEARQIKIQEYTRNRSSIVTNTKIAFEEAKTEMGICCFSENYNTLLMWSHYTDKHKGLCIGFSLEPVSEYYLFGKVKYTEKIERKNFFDDENNASLLYLVLTKSHFWQYEEELRAIALEYKGLVDIHFDCVKKIIFGYRSEDSYIKKILHIVRKNYPQIDVYTRMELDPDTFGLKESSPMKITE